MGPGHAHLDHFAISGHSWLLCAFAPTTLLEELPFGHLVTLPQEQKARSPGELTLHEAALNH